MPISKGESLLIADRAMLGLRADDFRLITTGVYMIVER
jgi:hypothetical protein